MKKHFLFLLLLATYQAFPCTSFILRDSHNSYLCKNFDYFTGQGYIFVNQRNDIKIGPCLPPEKSSQWISKYGSITFNLYGKDMPMSGMNEQGLVIESLWLYDTEYPIPDQREAVPELGWIQYMLDNCSTIEEVIEADKQIRIANTSMAKVHFIMLDKNGRSASVEFLKGRSFITSGSDFFPEVIENQTYPQSIEFMKNNPLGSKCYEKPIVDKRERFEMASRMIDDRSADANPVDYCFDILKMATWITENGDAPTQWSLVYDNQSRKIYFKTKDHPNVKTLDLNDFNFQCTDEVLVTHLQTSLTDLKTIDFKKYDPEEAKLHLRRVYEAVPFTKGKLPDEMINAMVMATSKKPCIP